MVTQKELQIVNFLHYLSIHPWVAVLVALLAIWIVIWKGTALWKAGRNNQLVWFIVMLLLNTAGILEIVYIFFFQKKRETGIK